MCSDLALLDRAGSDDPSADEKACLSLLVGDAVWSVPLRSVLGIGEAGPVLPFPLVEPPVAGLSELDGRPLLRVALADSAGRSRPRLLVGIATRAGDIAIAADAVERTRSAPRFEIARHLPWTGGYADVRRPAPVRSGAAISLPLMLVRCGTETLAVRAERLQQVDRPAAIRPLPGSAADRLVEAACTLLAARPVPGTQEPDRGFALLLAGDRGERVALLVDQALEVERCAAERLVPVRHPDGGRSLWWRRDDGPPIRVVDPGDMFGWTSAAIPDADECRDEGHRTARPEVLLAEVAGITVAVPLPLVAGVEEAAAGPAHTGSRQRIYDAGRFLGRDGTDPSAAGLLSLAGIDGLFRVDRILPLTASAIGWQPLGAVPPLVAHLFDSIGRDEERSRWVLRLRGDLLHDPVSPVPKRLLVASRVGRADA